MQVVSEQVMAKKKTATGRVSRKNAKKPAKKAERTKSAAKKATRQRPPATKRRVRATAPPSLGRPAVTADEKLYLLFKEDFHARQVFEFLRVETVRDLEAYSPQEIIRLLSQPLRETVSRIRTLLAEKNRHLQDDRDFALEHHAKASARPG